MLTGLVGERSGLGWWLGPNNGELEMNSPDMTTHFAKKVTVKIYPERPSTFFSTTRQSGWTRCRADHLGNLIQKRSSVEITD